MRGTVRANSKLFLVPKNGQITDAKAIAVQDGKWTETIELPRGQTEVFLISVFKPEGRLAKTLPVYWVQDIWGQRRELRPDEFERAAGVKVTAADLDSLSGY